MNVNILPDDVRTALVLAQAWAIENASRTQRAANAEVYIQGVHLALATYGLYGMKSQLLYILGNLSGWRGDEARATKKVLGDYQKTLQKQFEVQR